MYKSGLIGALNYSRRQFTIIECLCTTSSNVLIGKQSQQKFSLFRRHLIPYTPCNLLLGKCNSRWISFRAVWKLFVPDVQEKLRDGNNYFWCDDASVLDNLSGSIKWLILVVAERSGSKGCRPRTTSSRRLRGAYEASPARSRKM